jgi:hypothetical protein
VSSGPIRTVARRSKKPSGTESSSGGVPPSTAASTSQRAGPCTSRDGCRHATGRTRRARSGVRRKSTPRRFSFSAGPGDKTSPTQDPPNPAAQISPRRAGEIQGRRLSPGMTSPSRSGRGSAAPGWCGEQDARTPASNSQELRCLLRVKFPSAPGGRPASTRCANRDSTLSAEGTPVEWQAGGSACWTTARGSHRQKNVPRAIRV